MDRVLIRAGDLGAAMRVSLPGYDVNVASIDQLAFDARFACLEVFRKGTVNIVGSGVANTVAFGETVLEPPLGFFAIGNATAGSGPNFLKTIVGSTITTVGFYVAVGRSSMTLQTTQLTFGSTVPVRYILFRPLAA